MQHESQQNLQGYEQMKHKTKKKYYELYTL